MRYYAKIRYYKKWLTADALDSVEWLEADIELIAELKSESIAQISDDTFGIKLKNIKQFKK